MNYELKRVVKSLKSRFILRGPIFLQNKKLKSFQNLRDA
jgi:hypothetical protein